MLHLPSYNCGLAAGTVAKALDHPKPVAITDFPGLREIDGRAEDRFFFPTSYIEGFLDAYNYPERRFSVLPSDSGKKA